MTPNGPGLSRDIDQLRNGSTATAAELRAYLNTMRGKSPQEVLGSVAQSSLAQGTFVATVATVLFVGVFTVIPWKMAQNAPPASKKPVAAAKPAETTAQPDKAAPAAQPAETATASKPEGKPDLNQKVLDNLGVSEAKTADPNFNPLDKKDDDLLKDLK